MIYASYAIYIYISLSLSLSHRLLLSLWHPPFIHTFMFNSSNSVQADGRSRLRMGFASVLY